MTEQEVKKLIHEELLKCGIKMPVEETFDYSCTADRNKSKLFVKLTNGDYKNAIYVKKDSNWRVPADYYDLLFAVNENGSPISIPIPVAKQLWKVLEIKPEECRSTITGTVYETIYRHYYQTKTISEMPF